MKIFPFILLNPLSHHELPAIKNYCAYSSLVSLLPFISPTSHAATRQYNGKTIGLYLKIKNSHFNNRLDEYPMCDLYL